MFKMLQKLMFASKQNSDRKLEMLNIFVFSGTLFALFFKVEGPQPEKIAVKPDYRNAGDEGRGVTTIYNLLKFKLLFVYYFLAGLC